MSRKFRISVNGKSYDVDVEELGAGAASAAPIAAPAAAPAPVAAPVAAPAAAPSASNDTSALLAAIATAWALDISPELIAAGIKTFDYQPA